METTQRKGKPHGAFRSLVPPPGPLEVRILLQRKAEEYFHLAQSQQFDPKRAVEGIDNELPIGSTADWEQFSCRVAMTVLHGVVDDLHYTSRKPTAFAQLEQVFLDVVQLEFAPEVTTPDNRLHPFGRSKPSLCLTTTTVGAAPILDEASRAAVRGSVLLSALAIYLSSLPADDARGFALMVKATFGELAVTGLPLVLLGHHATSDAASRIVEGFGGGGGRNSKNHNNGRAAVVLGKVDAAFEAFAVQWCCCCGCGSGGGGSGGGLA